MADKKRTSRTPKEIQDDIDKLSKSMKTMQLELQELKAQQLQ